MLLQAPFFAALRITAGFETASPILERTLQGLLASFSGKDAEGRWFAEVSVRDTSRRGSCDILSMVGQRLSGFFLSALPEGFFLFRSPTRWPI